VDPLDLRKDIELYFGFIGTEIPPWRDPPKKKLTEKEEWEEMYR